MRRQPKEGLQHINWWRVKIGGCKGAKNKQNISLFPRLTFAQPLVSQKTIHHYLQ